MEDFLKQIKIRTLLLVTIISFLIIPYSLYKYVIDYIPLHVSYSHFLLYILVDRVRLVLTIIVPFALYIPIRNILVWRNSKKLLDLFIEEYPDFFSCIHAQINQKYIKEWFKKYANAKNDFSIVDTLILLKDQLPEHAYSIIYMFEEGKKVSSILSSIRNDICLDRFTNPSNIRISHYKYFNSETVFNRYDKISVLKELYSLDSYEELKSKTPEVVKRIINEKWSSKYIYNHYNYRMPNKIKHIVKNRGLFIQNYLANTICYVILREISLNNWTTRHNAWLQREASEQNERKRLEQQRKEEQRRSEKRKELEEQFEPLWNKYSNDVEKWFNDRYSKDMKNWGIQEINGIPYVFLFYYYPANRVVSPMHSKRTSRIVTDYKAGRIDDDVEKKLIIKIKEHFDRFYQYCENNAPKKPKMDYNRGRIEYYSESPYTMNQIKQYFTFMCIPPSSQSKYIQRCREFSKRICKELGIANGFEPKENVFSIEVGNSIVPKHMGGDDTNEKLYVDKPYFKGKHLILFDDIVTSGKTMQKWITRFHEWGATVDFIISLGYTYRDEFGDVEDPVKFE